MIKLEVPIEIEENEMTRIKNVFQTQLNYNICKVDIGKEKVILTFKYVGEDAGEKIL